MSPFPGAWKQAKLGDVADWGSGGTPRARDPRYYGGPIPWAVIGDLPDGVVRSTANTITSDGLTASSAKLVPVGAVLIAMYGSIGKLGITGVEMSTNQAIAFAIPRADLIDRSFLFYYLLSQRKNLASAGKGATQQNIGQGTLKSWPIALPSLSEQRRIVDILENNLSRLDAAKSDLDLALRRIDLLRASVLTTLVVPPEAREVLHTGPALLGQERPPRLKLPDGWQWAQWRTVGTSENGRAFPSRDYQDSGVRLLRPGNLGPDGSLRWSAASTRHLPASYLTSHPGSVLRANDLVMNLTAQSLKDDFLGRICIVRPGDESLLNQRIARLRATGVDTEFALAVFQSRLFRHFVKSLNTGSLIQHMFTSQLNRFWFPLPPESDQRGIAVAAAQLQSETVRRIAAVELQVRRAELLRKSVIAAAFSGRLTGQ